MADVTLILQSIEDGDPHAAEQLLPLVYEELRRLAAAKMSDEKPGQTLQATALVHEAYLRLVDGERARHWSSRRHFFAAAAESMRRILVDRARRKRRLKWGGDKRRAPLEDVAVADLESPTDRLDLVALDEALARLANEAPEKAQVVQLRFFGGLSHEQIADILGVSTVTVKRHWRYARAWLLRQMDGPGDLPG